MEKVTLKDKTFEMYIPYADIEKAIVELGKRISDDYKDKDVPVFLGVLNGSFMFMADLMKNIEVNCETSFVKLASYSGTESTGKVKELIGVSDNITGRHVVVVEDIVDSGQSIVHLMDALMEHKPASVEVATLLLKPEAYKKDIPIKYHALTIPNDFIVGFGLDYDQLGRNLKNIYKIVE